MNIFLKEAEEMEPFIIEFRHDLHMHPELSMKEFRTTGQVAKELDAIGIPYRRFEPSGLMAEIRGNLPGTRTIGLRADIDALPIQETADVPYRSRTDGVMHACGHDTHCAMLLGAVRLLAAHRDAFGGTVRAIFQPGEEGAGGAHTIIQQGAADGVDLFFGMHCSPLIPTGSLGCCEGAGLAATTVFTIRVHGLQAHGATPEASHDALLAACQIVNNLQSIVSRRLAPQDPCVVTVGTIQAGDAFNIIPGEAVLTGTCRYFNRSYNTRIPELMQEISSGVASAYGCSAEVEYRIHTDVLSSDHHVCELVWTAADKILDFQAHPELKLDFKPMMAGDDFGEYTSLAPSAFFFLGLDGCGPGHNGNFQVRDDGLKIGAALFAQTAVDALTE